MASKPPSAPPRSRSVNDYDSAASLRNALRETESKDCDEKGEKNSQFDWVLQNFDKETTNAQSLEEEMSRLLVLRSYLILDAEKEQSFERITALASRMFQVPIALVSLVDLGRQWFMSNRGLGDARETPRNLAFCAHAILSTQDVLVVPDATKDPRFMNNGLVTGDPHIRFYAGAPLICPEGYKLGTLCVIDVKTRPEGLTFVEKQNLRELAALVIETMVARKREHERVSDEKSRVIACTAHDLLTPLTGIQLNLSLFMDDSKLWSSLEENQKELVQTAISCSDAMAKICHQAIMSFRSDYTHPRLAGKKRKLTREIANGGNEQDDAGYDMDDSTDSGGGRGHEFERDEKDEGAVVIASLVENLRRVIEPFPKKVPLSINVDEGVPAEIISDDLKIFRSALNYLTNACKKTEHGCITLSIYVNKKGGEDGLPGKDVLIFECEDTGPGVDVSNLPNLFVPCFQDNGRDRPVSYVGDQVQMANSGLGLFSVACSISSLGGEYGYRPRELSEDEGMDEAGENTTARLDFEESLTHIEGQDREEGAPTGSVFWFSVPLTLPEYANRNFARERQNLSNSARNDIGVGEELDVQNNVAPIHEPPNDHSNVTHLIENTSDTDAYARDNHSTDGRAKPDKGGTEPRTSSKRKALDAVTFLGSSKDNQRIRRALVIDDSITIRKGLARALTKLGYFVEQAEEGMEGLEKLKTALYDFVLCDFLMPAMDGLDCVQQYRAWESKHRSWFRQWIVGISAHATTGDADRGMAVGMDHFSAKPVLLKTLKEISISDEVAAVSAQLDNKYAEIKASSSDGTEISLNTKDDASVSSVSVLDNSGGPVCLIAEDCKTIAKTLVRALESRGWRTCVVHNGEDALRLLKMRNWEAVFLDDDMPRLNGTSCVLRFRDWESQNRVVRQNNVILVTGHFVPQSNSVYPSGFDGAMGKPIKMAHLSTILGSITARDKKGNLLIR